MLRDKFKDDLPQQSFWTTLKYGLKLVWATGPRYCLTMGIGALLGALIAPITIIAFGMIVNELKDVVKLDDLSATTSVSSELHDIPEVKEKPGRTRRKSLAETSNSTEEHLSPSFNFWIALIAIGTFAGIVLGGVQTYAKLRLKDSLSLEMQKKILSHAASLDASILDDRECRDILQRANTNPGANILNLLDGLIKVASGSLQIITITGVLLWIQPWWTLGLIIAVVPILLTSFGISRIKHHYQRIRTTQRRWTGYYSKMLTNRGLSQVVRVLGLRELMLTRHEEKTRELLDDNRRIGLIQLGLRCATSLILLGLITGAIWHAAHQAAVSALDIGKFTAFWLAAWKFRDATGKVGQSVSSLIDAKLSIIFLNDFFDLKPRMESSGSLTPVISGSIELINVDFRYTERGENILENISLKLEPGEVVALVGPNGAGKTTLANLIARLYAPTAGSILVDGVPIQEIELDHYYRHVALVQQSAPKFEATVGENIAFGDWENLQDNPEEILSLAEVADVKNLIDHMPEGLNTMLGRQFGDYDLSGGQWKKISLARSLAGNRKIVILDEPAANLDIQTERLVHEQLKKKLEGRTAILISHHFSSVMMADRIIVLVDGCIEEEGTHQELKNAGGIYSSMCKTHRELIDDPIDGMDSADAA